MIDVKPEIVDLFSIIDSSNKGYITSTDIENSPKLIPREILNSITFDFKNKLSLEDFALMYERSIRNYNSDDQNDEMLDEDFGKFICYKFQFEIRGLF